MESGGAAGSLPTRTNALRRNGGAGAVPTALGGGMSRLVEVLGSFLEPLGMNFGIHSLHMCPSQDDGKPDAQPTRVRANSRNASAARVGIRPWERTT